jgi:catechol 2,3-dioxygenase-like lactoylglutathione lyase family enzyme
VPAQPGPARLDHVTLTASDFAASLRFYDAALGALGLARLYELGDEEEDQADVEAAAYGTDGDAASLWLVAGPVVTAATHVAFRADARERVERFHAAALAAGGTSHGAPRRWPIYRRGEFNAIVRDPDGNLLEAISAE